MDRWGEPNSDREYAAAVPGAPRRLIRTTIQETPHIEMQNFDVARGKTDHATSKGRGRTFLRAFPVALAAGQIVTICQATRRTGPSISPQTPSGREAISLEALYPRALSFVLGVVFLDSVHGPRRPGLADRTSEERDNG
jgi:hypothetical protein